MKKIQLLTIAILCLVAVLSVSFLAACSQATPTTTAPTTTAPAPKPTTSAPTTIAPTTVAPTTAAPTTSSTVYKLSYNINYNLTQVAGKYCLYFADQLNKASNGRLKVTTYASGTLSGPEAVYQTVITGIADIGQHTITYTPGQFLAVEATHVPYNFADGWVSTHVDTDFVNNFKPKSMDAVQFFFAAAPGPYAVMTVSKNPTDVLKPADMKGKKVRVSGSIGTALVTAWGGTPIAVTMNDTYEAASKALIDVMVAPIEPLKGWNFADVVRSVTILPVGYCTMNVAVMNKDKWNALPKDLQDVFMKVSADMPDKVGKAWWYSDLDAMDYFLGKGGKVYSTVTADNDAWVAPTVTEIDKYIAQANAAGLPGADYVKYVKDRGAYWNANHTAQKDETIAWMKANMLPLQ
jgi:TRAP-type transport system periplasmic protein